jgi:hypothetical protein
MMGSRKLNNLLDLVHKAGAKITMIGDHRQLQPVEAGAAVRMLRQGLGASEMVEMQRQKEDWQQKATHFFAQGKALEALNAYGSRGCLSIHQKSEDARQDLVEKYVQNLQKSPQKSSLIIAETNAQVTAINQEVREKLKIAGRLALGVGISVKDTYGNNKEREFSKGDRVIFLKNSRKLRVQNGLMGEVLEVKKSGVGHDFLVKTDHGDQIKFNSQDYKSLDHGFAVTVYKSQGDTVDNVSYLLADYSSREASYVAMSRHREGAHIFIDQSSFSETIDWKNVKTLKTSIEKSQAVSKAVIDQAAKVMSQPQAKDTSLDYGNQAQEIYVTPQVVNMALKLGLESVSKKEKIDLVYEIATAHQGSSNRLQSPPSGQAFYQKTAGKILAGEQVKDEDFKKLSDQILNLKTGFQVTPSEQMKRDQNEIKNNLKTHLEKHQQQGLKIGKGPGLSQ